LPFFVDHYDVSGPKSRRTESELRDEFDFGPVWDQVPQSYTGWDRSLANFTLLPNFASKTS